MKSISRFRLILSATAFVLVIAAAIPQPARSAACYHCAPDPDIPGLTYCHLGLHGMTQCLDDAGTCVLGGSTC